MFQTNQFFVVAFTFLLGGCTWFSAEIQPEWVLSPQSLYPIDQYLTGLGEAESRTQAEQRAYAAVARIFSANVQAQSMDYESYTMEENGNRSRAQRSVQLNQRTHITTNKVLENVKIFDVWYQPSNKQYFALAGLDRRQTEALLVDRLSNLDGNIKTFLNQGRSHTQKIQRIRGYKQAMIRLSERKILNEDLRVVRPSGRSQSPPFRISDIQKEFQDFVAKELVISVAMTGEYSEKLERAIVEGLKKEGLVGRTASMFNEETGRTEDIAIIGQSKLWRINLPDPLFKYVRWCGDLDIYEQPSQRLIGTISETGREGHVTEREAKIRANGTMQQVLSQKAANLLTQSIFQTGHLGLKQQRATKTCPQ